LRFNWFLPFLRKSIKGPPRKAPGLLVRLCTAIIPARLSSDVRNGKPGLFRRILKTLGKSWSYSPFRKASQAFFFTGFCVLFFYVAWPYSARPARLWHGWTPIEVDPESGVTKIHLDQPALDGIAQGDTIHIIDAAAATTADGKPASLGEFRITLVLPVFTQGAGASRTGSGPPEPRQPQSQEPPPAGFDLVLSPVTKPPTAAIEALSFSTGPWTLSEKHPAAWPSHYADDLAKKEIVHAETLLIIDPLVALSTALAAKAWVWSLIAAGIIIAVCIFIPRGFCGYICPLGTLTDLFDWVIGTRFSKYRPHKVKDPPDNPWYVHLKYYILVGVLIASMMGILLSGFVAAIPVITRGFLFVFKPVHDGLHREWHNVPPINAGQIVSIVLFFGVLALGFIRPRFWCKYVCPSGAVFSVFNLFRATERKVESSCISCNKCVEVCPFDAIKPDFTTRTTDCTLCQTCGGACPVDAIKFVSRGDRIELKVLNDPPTHETALGRRGFLASSIGLASAIAGGVTASLGVKALGANLDDPNAPRPVRPPGSVPEQAFLQMCIRCGECFKACPNDVLQPLGFQQGLEGLWTPHVVADWAGCEVSCNACGQVCPTGAIRALPLEEKKAARMGLAIVNEKTCLPFAGREACQLCVDECVAAGYHAIEFINVGTKADAEGNPIEGTGLLAPVVLADKCVGCGLCQTRCRAINVAEKALLDESAIIIQAGRGRDDRLMTGSYIQLRIHQGTRG
jgi:polyferredoxin